MKLHLNSGKTYDLEKSKYYRREYLQYLANAKRITLFDLAHDQLNQCLTDYLAKWRADLANIKTQYLSQSIHMKINNKSKFKYYVRIKHVVEKFINNQDELIFNCLENLQEFKIIDSKVVNVTYEGMNLGK